MYFFLHNVGKLELNLNFIFPQKCIHLKKVAFSTVENCLIKKLISVFVHSFRKCVENILYTVETEIPAGIYRVI